MKPDNVFIRLKFSALVLLIWAGFSLTIRILQGFTDTISTTVLSISFLEMFIIIISCVLVLFKKYSLILLASLIYVIDTIEFAFNPVKSSIAVLIRLVLLVFAIGGVINYIAYRVKKLNKLEQNSVNSKPNLDKPSIEPIENFTDLEKYIEIDDSNMSDAEKMKVYGEVLGLKGNISKLEITKFWRDMLENYHPDKVSHLGKEFQIFAEKKTKDINKAYSYFRRKYNF